MVGVLAPSHSPDDGAVFVDVRTAWVIQGLGHGHADLERPEAAASVLARDGDVITANAALVQYNEIDPDNQDSFHFHGDLSDYPLTAVVAFPGDAKADALLQGRYQGADERNQIVRPRVVIEELLGTVFTVQGYVVAALAFVGVSTVATTALVFLLSYRLRRREVETLVRLGAARGAVATVLALEVLFVLAASLALAGVLTAATSRFGAELLRALALA